MIEITGFAVRAPGARNKSEFWDVLQKEVCTVSEIPEDRWSKFHYFHPRQKEPGKSYTFAAGVIDDVWGFDPTVFGISPREAEQMDPQQRLLLETTWEAIEDSAIAPSRLAGENVGVYVGASALDYGSQSIFDPSVATGHFMTGNTLSIISNRLSYIFDLKGPSFTVDTACSSSLVALNEAFLAIKSGKIDTAIVAGVNVLTSPFPFVGFAQATMLSPEGLCRAFDDNGMGYVRAEGCVSLVLRRSDVEKWPGQRSHADLVAVDINSDGKTVGLSLPSSNDQAALLEQIYNNNNIDPNDLAFVEAHGTGTRVGDPAEAESIGKILAQNRSSALPIGSAKTNFGHLEPASGLIGLVKSILALKNDFIPASLHFEKPNSHIDFEELNLEVVSKGMAIPRSSRPRYAGVNSFGFGGTNAHVIISDPANKPQNEKIEVNNCNLLMLSAQTQDALRDTAKAYSTYLSNSSEEQLSSICQASYFRKHQFRERLVIQGKSKEEYINSLIAFSDHEIAGNLINATKKIGVDQGKCAFVFSGNGCQWPGMGRDAYETNEEFRISFDKISALFDNYLDYSLSEVLFSDDLEEQLEFTSIAQPLIFAVQISLVETLATIGIKPDISFGHSIGELAASVAAEKLSIEEAVRLVYIRSANQEIAAGTGTMGALVVSQEEATALINESGFKNLEIGAINSHKSVTLSGSHEDIEGFAKFARSKKIIFRKLGLNYPFHSSLIRVVEKPFKEELESVKGLSSDTTMISTVTGATIDGADLDAEYWWRNLCDQVKFSAASEKAYELGATFFIEIGPKPILQSYLRQSATKLELASVILASLEDKQKVRQLDPIKKIAAKLLAEGMQFAENSLFIEDSNCHLELPAYQWQRQQFRFEETDESIRGFVKDVRNPLLGWSANSDFNIWQTHIDPFTIPFLADHIVNDQLIFPGTGYVEILLAVARERFGDSIPVEIKTMDIVSAMHLSDQFITEVRTVFYDETGTVEISSRRRGSGDEWLLNAKGRIFEAVTDGEYFENNTSSKNLGDVVASGQEIYAIASSYGLNFGPSFRNAKLITRIDEANYRVQLNNKTSDHSFGVHPAELDSCFHGLLALFDLARFENDDHNAYVPIYFDKVQQLAAGASPAFAEISIRKFSSRTILADFKIFDEDNRLILSIADGRFRAVAFSGQSSSNNLIYRIESEVSNLLTNTTPTVLPSPNVLLETLEKTGAMESNEESEGRILLDAACQIFASEICDLIADKNQVLNIENIPDKHRGYFQNLLNLMVRINEWLETEENLYERAKANDLPDFDLIVKSIVAESPEETSSAAILSLARKSAIAILNQENEVFCPSGALLDHFRFGTPSAVELKKVAGAWLDLFMETWPQNKPLKMLCLAGIGRDLALQVLQKHPEAQIEICVAEIDSSSAARLINGSAKNDNLIISDVSKGWENLPKDTVFDVVLSSGQLHTFCAKESLFNELFEHLAEDTAFAAFEPTVDNFHDFAFGFQDNWFDEGLSEEFPIGPLKMVDEWVSLLKELNFVEIAGLERVFGGIPLNIISAKLQQPLNAIIDAEKDNHTFWTFIVPDDLKAIDQIKQVQNVLEEPGCLTAQFVLPQTSFDAENNPSWLKIRNNPKFISANARYIVHMAATTDVSDATPLEDVMDLTLPVISIAKTLDGLEAVYSFLNPGGSGLVCGDKHHPIQSAFWTFSRVFTNEIQNFSVKSIDVNLDNSPEELAKIFLQSVTSLNQNEFIYQDNQLLTSKVVKGLPLSNYKPATNVSLSFNQPGSLEGLNWVEIGDLSLGATDVEIDVTATALNFRDLMWAMGMLPEEALEDGYGGASMGLECSGRVVRVGKQVKHLQEGDQVVAFTSAGFGNRVVVPAFGVAKIPEHQELISAATMPVAFLTAYYSLMELGGLKKDQWVVIHGAAGGVGLAALQIVKWAGAKVIATAGSEEKRELLKILGAEHVLNSRSLEFSEQVKQITGEGAHIVLNSLAGEAMERGIQALRPFGRFLELGKRDYYANTKIGLRPFRKNVSYFGIDLDQLLKHDQEYASSMIKDVFSLVNDGTFTPLPYRVFEGEQVQDAFRLMQRSGQIGKILIRPPLANTIKVLDKVKPISFSADGAHVIIGGLGGFGSEIAKWVADHGAKTIVLTSRKGVIDKQHEEVIKKLKLMGISVIVKSCDVTHHISVENLLSELREIMPIKSIIHAAMVLDDGIITSLDAKRFEKVLSPKIKGADNLNKLTWQDELEHFILFSSATTMFGNPGQANYVAANGYLEGLARERRIAGRPAIAIGWGAIGDVGFLAQNQETSDKLSRFLGDAMIGARQGLDILADAMARDDGQVENAVLHIGKFDWASASAALPMLQGKMFEKIVKSLEKSADTETQIDLAELIAGKDDSDAIPIISELMKSEISAILRLPMEEIDLARPLSELGMDSLMGLELRMSIQKKFDLEMPLVALSGTTSLSDIVTQMLKTIKASENADTQTLDANKMMLAQQHLSTDTDFESLLAIDAIVDQKRKKSNGLME